MVQGLWQRATSPEGTLVEQYLRTRGFTQAISKSIRFLPDAWHSPTQTNYPAMLCAVTDNQQETVQALHRTFLSTDGHKAPIQPNKMTLGAVGGLSIHLTEARETLAITEGIETGLSVLQATEIPVWVALSAGGIQNLILPPLPLAQEVLICADHDSVGLRAAYFAADQWTQQGRVVRVVYPPKPGMDFNDLLLGLGGDNDA